MDAMTYEGFVRGAFSIKLNTLIDRSGDIGGLAEADIFRGSHRPHNLNEVKIGTGYAISAYNNEIFNSDVTVSEHDYIRMEELLDLTLTATTPNDILRIIEEYKTYRSRYFVHIWNRQ